VQSHFSGRHNPGAINSPLSVKGDPAKLEEGFEGRQHPDGIPPGISEPVQELNKFFVKMDINF
jgi:hypothetical protein